MTYIERCLERANAFTRVVRAARRASVKYGRPFVISRHDGSGAYVYHSTSASRGPRFVEVMRVGRTT